MKKDWRWGWIGLLPGVVAGYFLTDRLGLLGRAFSWEAIAIWAGSAGILATAILWIVNRRSVRKLELAGSQVQLVVRPLNAIMEAPAFCLAMFGAMALAKLVWLGEVSNWQVSLIICCVWGYLMALADTAYRSAD